MSISSSFTADEYHQAAHLAYVEVLRSRKMGYAPFASAQEGYTVLKEEMYELRREVQKKKSAARLEAMREEVIQIAAMAIAFLVEVAE
jgi:NTP pyrophosphatase (non-canonical NTP hydrolase)